MPPESTSLTVGITTRNRPASLARCLTSLQTVEPLISKVIVVDDSSDAPVREALEDVPQSVREKLVFVEQPGHRGYIVARNDIVRRASTPFVLLLDDDTVVEHPTAVADALHVLVTFPGVAAVAFAQADPAGAPWPSGTQPSAVDYPCLVPAFIGFAHLLRRDLFLECGGYREIFHYYGEEKDLCLRLLDRGLHVAYLPHARVVHLPDPSGRSRSRYIRYAIRNDCLGALFNEPWPLPLVSVPVRLMRYLRMRRQGGVDDPGGFTWLAGEVLRALPQLGRERRAVSWRTLRAWRALRASAPPLWPGGAAGGVQADGASVGPLAGSPDLVHADSE